MFKNKIKTLGILAILGSSLFFTGCTVYTNPYPVVGTSYSYPYYYDRPYYYYSGRYYYGGRYLNGSYIYNNVTYSDGQYYDGQYRYYQGRKYQPVSGNLGYYKDRRDYNTYNRRNVQRGNLYNRENTRRSVQRGDVYNREYTTTYR